jgi:flagellar L-ring protein precursor FlgH
MVKTTGFLLIMGIGLTGCSSVTPSTILTQPTKSPAPEVDKSTPKNGSIYKKTTYKSLFENYRARVVGDVITVIVNEQVSADKKNLASDTKQGSLDIQAIGAGISNWQASEKGSVQNTGRATGSSSYNFTGAVAVNVIEVLENGNLVVTGEKQIGMDKGTEFIRVSGIVVPTLIDASNTISSNRLADARVEYRSNSNIDGSEIMKAINRFFSAFLMI